MPTFTAVERISMPAYADLHARYLARNLPVIVTDMAADWPAVSRWTPQFFKRNFGERTVAVTDKSYQTHGANYLTPFTRMSFADYLDAIESGNTDLRLFLFELFKFAPELRADIQLPAWAGLLSRVFLVSFFGGAGGASTFHYDVDLAHVFHTVLHGSKTFYLFGPDQSTYLYRHPWTVRSYIDVRDPDLMRFPRFANARGHRCEVRKGETLVIPSGHWHQAVYSQVSWGLSFRQYEAKYLVGGITNMVVQEPIDRVLARVMPKRWFAYKERAAGSRST
jgi:Cupin-like domain